LPEYDPLADLYDLEYSHDYDLPFWLSLAEREGGPIVEWGAGTGRLAVPLAKAGFDVTGVEVSAFSPEELVDPPGGPELRHDFTRELPDGRLDRFSVSRYDAASQLLSMRLFYELYGASGELKERRAHDLTIRVVGRGELELMLRLAGFEVEAVYGGFEGEPFASESDHLVVLARKWLVS
jgi:hypothetical protein